MRMKKRRQRKSANAQCDTSPKASLDERKEHKVDESWISSSAIIVFTIPTVTLTDLYLRTAFPTIAGGDSPELIAEACVGGVAHPPGYPLFTLLIQQLLKFHSSVSPAFKANAMCCILGGLTSGFIALSVFYAINAIRRKNHHHHHNINEITSSIVAAILYGAAPLTWEYSIGAEVFALNNCLTATLLFLTCYYAATKNPFAIAAGALISGLGLSNQHTIILFEAPLILFILAVSKPRRVSQYALYASLFFTGLSPYYYYTYKAGQVPTRGSWGDTSTVSGMLRHISREEYGSLSLSPMDSENTWTDFGHRLGMFCYQSMTETLYVGPVLAIIGLIWSFKDESKWLAKALVSAECTYVLVFNYLANIPLTQPLALAVFSRFWMQPNIILAIWAGFGMYVVGDKVLSNSKIMFTILTLVLACTQVYWNYSDRSQDSGKILHHYGQAVLQTLPNDSILLSHTDINWNIVRYLQECESMRPDVTHLSFQLMPFPWFSRQHSLYPSIRFPRTDFPGVSTNRLDAGNTKLILDFVRANIESHPNIYIDMHSINDAEIGHSGQYHGYYIYPIGMLWKIQKSPLDIDEWEKRSKNVFELMSETLLISQAEKSCDDGSWEFVSLTVYIDGVYQYALHLLGVAIEQSKTITPEGLPVYYRRMSSVVQALDKVLFASDTKGSVTFNKRDILKNSAVAHMRYYLAAYANKNIPADKLRRALSQARKVLTRMIKFDSAGKKDSAITVFKQFLKTHTMESLLK